MTTKELKEKVNEDGILQIEMMIGDFWSFIAVCEDPDEDCSPIDSFLGYISSELTGSKDGLIADEIKFSRVDENSCLWVNVKAQIIWEKVDLEEPIESEQ